MQLSKFQNKFKKLMLDQPEALHNIDSELTNLLHEDHIAIADRLSVYRNNVIGGITDMMVATFPLLKELIGEKMLEAMARSFIMNNPPDQGCLNTYGAQFPEFIEHLLPKNKLAYLPDIARFEIALNEAYYAKDDKAIDPACIAEAPIALRSSATLLQSRYPLIALHDFCFNKGEAPDLAIPSPSYVMIYRPDLETKIIPLEREEYAILQAISDRISLETLIESHSDFDFQSFLNKHIQLQSFAQANATAQR